MRARRSFPFDAYSALLYLGLVGVHALMGLARYGPFVFADETGYLMAARYLGGGALTELRGTSFYHVGYSLLLAPASWFASPGAFYIAAMMTNAVVLSTLFLILVVFMRRVLGLEGGRARLIAFVSSLYPVFIIQSTIAWAEVLLIPLFAFMVLAFHALLDSRSPGWGIAFGASVALLYTTHNRIAPVVPLAIIAVGWLLRRRQIPTKTAAAAAASIGVLGVVGVLLNARVNVVAYAAGERWTRVVRYLPDLGLDAVRWFFFEAVGQLWYLSVATMGLFLLGVVGVVRLSRQQRDQVGGATGLFLLLASGATFALSVLWLMPPVRTGADHRVYGRYNEAFLALFLAIGLHTLMSFNRKRVLRTGLVLAGFIALLGVLLPLGPGAAFLRKPPTSANIFAIVPIARLFGGRLHIAGITLAGAAAAFVLSLATWQRRFLALAVAAVLFVVATADVYTNKILVADRRYRQLEQMGKAVMRTGADEVAYDVTHQRSAGYYGYQFWLGEGIEMRRFGSENQLSPLRYVISAREWPEGIRCDPRRLFVDPEFDQALWVITCPS